VSKIEVRSPDGTELKFEGDAEEFERFVRFVAEDINSIFGARNDDSNSTRESRSSGGGANGRSPLSDLQRRLDALGATTDIERVAVMSHHAVEKGESGLTPEQAETWYAQLGLPKPGRWHSTFSNAKTRGYIYFQPGSGWRPTPAGENLATHGIRKPAAKQRSSRKRDTPEATSTR
jgi:hypothetical protein